MSEHRVDLAQLALIRDGTGHTIYSPSSSPIWLNCPGALIPNLLAPDDAGVDAAYGTVGHSVCQEWLTTGERPDHLIGTNQFIESGDWGFLIDIDEEMLAYAKECVDRCEWEPGDHLIEQKVWFSNLTPIPNQGGTMDFAAMRPGRCTVADHKFGKAETIIAKENPQLLLYALGIFNAYDWAYDFQEFVVRVNQPRLNNFDEWQCNRRYLMEFAEYVRERAAIAWQHDAPRTPGPKQCRFCKVRATCTANAQMQEDIISAAFNCIGEEVTPERMQAFKQRLDDPLDPFDMQSIAVGQLTTNQMAALKPFRKMAEAWWSALDAELYKRAAHGEHIPGFKMVEARTKRKISNEVEAIELLTDFNVPENEYMQRKFVSPAQIEKLLLKRGVKRAALLKLLQPVVYKPQGSATLVPESDPRDPISDLAAAVFDDLSASETQEDPETEEI